MGPGPSAIKKISDKVFFVCFFSPQLILQKSNGLFQGKLIISRGSRGGPTFFPGVGCTTFFQGGGPIAYYIKKPI